MWYNKDTERGKEVVPMKNLELFNEMLAEYDTLSFTHEYIFGFAEKGTIYMVVADSKVLPLVCTLDCASRSQGYALRFKPTKAQKNLLKMYNIRPLCSTEYFEAQVNGSQYNRGEIFEKLVTELFGQKWVKDNVSFTKDGDITVNGIAYQIKFEKATFTNEKTLAKMRTV